MTFWHRQRRRSTEDLDALIARALPDDLADDVGRRLERRVDRFLADLPPLADAALDARRQGLSVGSASTWSPRRELLAVASITMLALGSVWHVRSAPPLFAESIAQVQVVVAISEAIRASGGGDCVLTGTPAGVTLDAAGTAEGIDALVYRAWSPARIDVLPGGRILVTFAGTDGGPGGTVLVDGVTMLPVEIEGVAAGGAPWPIGDVPFEATCTWAPGPSRPATPSGRSQP